LETGRGVRAIETKEKVPALVFLPDSKKFVAWTYKDAGNNSVISLVTFDAAAGTAADTFTDRDRQVKCLAFTPDGELSVSGDVQGSVRIFVVAKRERLKCDIPTHSKA